MTSSASLKVGLGGIGLDAHRFLFALARLARGKSAPACCFALALTAGTWAAFAASPAPLPVLDAAFQDPPVSSRPHTFWHWMNGHVSREGITRDLEAMKAAGLGGFLLWNTSEGTPPGPVK